MTVVPFARGFALRQLIGAPHNAKESSDIFEIKDGQNIRASALKRKKLDKPPELYRHWPNRKHSACAKHTRIQSVTDKSQRGTRAINWNYLSVKLDQEGCKW